jgi:WhiB family redox-sensing transcriptional regulator
VSDQGGRPFEFGRSYLRTLEAEADAIGRDRTTVDLRALTTSPASTATGSRPVPVVEDTDWRQAAACNGVDAALFFPERGDALTAAQAKVVCDRCPVVEQCLQWALLHHERFGVWGGKSEQERGRLRAGSRRTICRGCRKRFVRASQWILYCDVCRVERGDKRWMPESETEAS